MKESGAPTPAISVEALETRTSADQDQEEEEWCTTAVSHHQQEQQPPSAEVSFERGDAYSTMESPLMMSSPSCWSPGSHGSVLWHEATATDNNYNFDDPHILRSLAIPAVDEQPQDD